jgi:hypothetical protein
LRCPGTALLFPLRRGDGPIIVLLLLLMPKLMLCPRVAPVLPLAL